MMNNKILITGSKGFLGQQAYQFFQSKKFEVKEFIGDITSLADVEKNIENHDFDAIFHFAGISSPSLCNKDPTLAFNINVQGTINLLETLLKFKKTTKFIFASTCHVYDTSNLNEKTKIEETSAVKPNSLYARTKLLSEKVIESYFKHYNLGQALILRLFNHTHHTQKGSFFFNNIIQKINESKKLNLKEKISAGNLNLYRDFSLVSDLMFLLDKTLSSKINSSFEIINVCSSQKRLLKNLADLLAMQLGTDLTFLLEEKPDHHDGSLYLIGSHKKATELLQWAPKKLSDEEYVDHYFKN